MREKSAARLDVMRTGTRAIYCLFVLKTYARKPAAFPWVGQSMVVHTSENKLRSRKLCALRYSMWCPRP